MEKSSNFLKQMNIDNLFFLNCGLDFMTTAIFHGYCWSSFYFEWCNVVMPPLGAIYDALPRCAHINDEFCTGV